MLLFSEYHHLPVSKLIKNLRHCFRNKHLFVQPAEYMNRSNMIAHMIIRANSNLRTYLLSTQKRRNEYCTSHQSWDELHDQAIAIKKSIITSVFMT